MSTRGITRWARAFPWHDHKVLERGLRFVLFGGLLKAWALLSRTRVWRLLIASLFCVGCHVGALPRTGISGANRGAFEFGFQALSVEQQYVRSYDGLSWSSRVGFYPDIWMAARYTVAHRCELGGGGNWDRLYGEARCGLFQEHLGAPFSLALSAAGGPQLQDITPWGRVGLDLSKSFGVITPLIDLYLSRADEQHAVSISPRPGQEVDSPYIAETLRRYETRVIVPFGLAFRAARDQSGELRFVIGAAPYWIVSANNCQGNDCPGRQYHVDHGAEITLGLEYGIGR